jgi:hypothetical protein
VRSCRSRGYVIERVTDGVILTYELLARLSPTMPRQDLIAVLNTVATTALDIRYLLEDVKAKGRYPVNMIAAPVYDAEGNPVQIVAVYLHQHNVLGTHITRCRKALLEATATITAELGGFDPW